MTHPLTAYRRRHRLTLEAFGDRVGASKGTIFKWEKAAALPRPKAMRLILEATAGEVTPKDIIDAFGLTRREAAE